jgi:hypothetical protein
MQYTRKMDNNDLHGLTTLRTTFIACSDNNMKSNNSKENKKTLFNNPPIIAPMNTVVVSMLLFDSKSIEIEIIKSNEVVGMVTNVR